MQYRLADLEEYQVGRNEILVHSPRTGSSSVVSVAELQLLASCDRLLELSEHARECCDALEPALLRYLAAHANGQTASSGPEVSSEAVVTRCLERFAKNGLLVPRCGEDEGSDAVAASDAAATLSSVCIPSCERPASLARALSSYLANATRHGRRATFIICDDSRAEEAQRATEDAVRQVIAREGGTARFLSRGRRLWYAEELSRYSGLPADVVRFALLGDPRLALSYGATRNALLLDTIGELCLQADDDTICDVRRTNGLEPGVELTAMPDPNEYWFFSDIQSAQAVVQDAEIDFLGLSEAVLGRSPASLLASAERSGMPSLWTRNSGRLTQSFREPAARVAMSFAGIVGDCGGPGRAHWRLRLNGPSFERLVTDDASFSAALTTRQLVKCPARLSLTNCAHCIAPVLGLDNSMVLPPFSPVQIGEDTSFGMAMAAIHPSAFSAFLPYAVLHQPPESRVAPHTPMHPTLLTNTVIQNLTAQISRAWAWTDPEAALGDLGAYFTSLGRMRTDMFARHVRGVVFAAISQETRSLDVLIATRKGSPPYWVRSAQASRWQHLEMMRTEKPFAPTDLPGTASDRQRLFQEIVLGYGKLLTAWPTLRKAAVELREKGIRLSTPVSQKQDRTSQAVRRRTNAPLMGIERGECVDAVRGAGN
jgi:hypothetical protein